MSRCLRSLFAILCVIGSAAVAAAPTIALVPGQPTSFNLAGNAYTNNFFIDVPSSSQRLTIQLTGGAGAGDIDLLLSSAAPFSDQANTTQLFDAAQYRSASIESNETLFISRANKFPVRAGRWYLSVVNFAATGATPTLTATLSDSPPGAVPSEIVFTDSSDDCGISEWNNAMARPPVAGNTGTTLGQQRQNAVREAMRLIGTELKSDVPVRVQACWSNLGAGNSFTLAQAGPRTLLSGEAWMPRSNTFYPTAPATKLGGATTCGLLGGTCSSTYDIRITFNDRVDTAEIQSNFYYGFTGSGGVGFVDFLSTSMHELAHGLGFISSINTRASEGPIGQKLEGRDDAFGHNLVGVSATDGSLERFMDMTDAERSAAITGVDRLRWDETKAITSSFNIYAANPAPENFIRMHTPATLSAGSSLAHTGTLHPFDLMNAQASLSQRSLQLAGPMLEAVGWAQATAGAPALPASNNLFDARRDGHGIDFVRVRDSLYVLTFYTYAANGEPEWYQALGNMVNGVFVGIPDATGKTLIRYRYTPGATPPQSQVPALSGTVSLDFNSPATQAPCNDGRPTASAVAVMTFSVGTDQNVRWCMEPVVSATARATPDFSGLWNAASADDGWGWSILNFRLNNQNGLAAILFYYDGAGNSTFAFAQSAAFASGTAYPVFHRRGYCRTCPTIAFNDQPAGMATFTFTQPSALVSANNRVTYDATPQNSVGGRFARTNSSFALLTGPQ